MIDLLLDGVASYPALFGACALSGLGVPVPEDVPLLVAGLQLDAGRFEWGPTLLTACAGVTVRDSLAWAIGRTLGERLLDTAWFRRVAPVDKIGRARTMLADHGPAAVLVGRFLIGFRAPMFLAAGASGVSYRRFLAWDLLGMTVAVPAMIVLGYAVGPPVLHVAARVVPGAQGLWVALALILAVAWLHRHRQRDRGVK